MTEQTTHSDTDSETESDSHTGGYLHLQVTHSQSQSHSHCHWQTESDWEVSDPRHWMSYSVTVSQRVTELEVRAAECESLTSGWIECWSLQLSDWLTDSEWLTVTVSHWLSVTQSQSVWVSHQSVSRHGVWTKIIWSPIQLTVRLSAMKTVFILTTPKLEVMDDCGSCSIPDPMVNQTKTESGCYDWSTLFYHTCGFSFAPTPAQ